MKYIFLTNQYLPKPGATGLCVHYVASELVRRGYNVSTVCYSPDSKQHEKIIDGVAVYYIPVPIFLRDVPSKGVVLKYIIRIVSIFAKLFHINNYPLRSSTLVLRYIKKVQSLLDDTEITIVSSYTPLEAVLALIKIKNANNKIRTVFYSTDTLSNEKGKAALLPANIRYNCGINWEKKILSIVDSAIIMECHKQHYLSNIFSEYHSKMRFANFPLLRESCDKIMTHPNGNYKKMVYAGTLYRVLRNPTYLCNILTQVANIISIKSIFMGGGDCDDIMASFESSSGGAIKFLGLQSHDTAEENIKNADVLLSIGNAESPMAPSKIFEYMSTGKPIIHTYTWDKDPCINPLKKYGNALLIDEKKKVDINQVVDFIVQSNILSYKMVKTNFFSATPEFTADIIQGNR